MLDRKARKGVEPGSFIDLLVKTTDRATGKPLSEESISQQVSDKKCMARHANRLLKSDRKEKAGQGLVFL